MFSNVTAEDRDEFDREVTMLAKLTHPCIMNLYGISQDHDGSLYMVTQQTKEREERERVRVRAREKRFVAACAPAPVPVKCVPALFGPLVEWEAWVGLPQHPELCHAGRFLLAAPNARLCFLGGGTQSLLSATRQVMEFCGGGDLAAYYTEPGFNNGEYARVGKELLSACAYLHERGIAHRDLKPENVLLETGTHKVKLADFGLAKKNRNTVTRGVGTPSYMVRSFFLKTCEGESVVRSADLVTRGG